MELRHYPTSLAKAVSNDVTTDNRWVSFEEWQFHVAWVKEMEKKLPLMIGYLFGTEKTDLCSFLTNKAKGCNKKYEWGIMK